MKLTCAVCGCEQYHDIKVLWKELISEWELSPEEIIYINRQQGTLCDKCNGSLRINALAISICEHLRSSKILKDISYNSKYKHLKILDINGSSSVSEVLSIMPNYIRADYPDVDMQKIPYDDNSFDLIIHSDTLEHIPDPVLALAECLRVINEQGAVCFTIPIVVGRLSKSREGLPKSFHGTPDINSDDFVVQTEFGADFWTYAFRAGATSVILNSAEYPSAQAIRIQKKHTALPSKGSFLRMLGFHR